MAEEVEDGEYKRMYERTERLTQVSKGLGSDGV